MNKRKPMQPRRDPQMAAVLHQIEENKNPQKRHGHNKPSNQNQSRPQAVQKTAEKTGEKSLKIIPLGGQEEVGRNMTVFEYGQDIIILDMGVQFPEEDMPGVDYIIPNSSYLRGKEKNIRGVIFSHGHLDHIGAAPIILKQLGYPMVVGRDFTLALVKRKMDDYEPNSATMLKTSLIKSAKDKLKLGAFEVGFFEIEHSIMDAVGVTLTTPNGTVVHPGDWTMDRDPIGREAFTYDHLSKLPRPITLMLESLGAVEYGEPTPEREMYANIEKIISGAEGRVIIGTFSSQVRRIGHILEYAQQIGKKVALDGYSMKMNVEIAKQLGYIKVHKETLIDIKMINNHPDNKVIIICTGAQGEDNAVLSRIVNDNHRFIKMKRTDTIIFSSSVIPGNERTIQRLKDNLYRKCDHVIHTDIMDVHTSGHCNAADIQDMIGQVKPDYFLPVYANHFFLKEAAKLAEEVGIPKENIFVLDNGHVLNFTQGKKPFIEKQKADTSYVFIDGLGVGDVGQVVLRDRQLLAQDGMFTIVVIIDSQTKKIIGNPQVTSRGFIYVKENFDLVNATKKVVEKVIYDKTSPDMEINWDYVKNNIREAVGSFLYQKTERRPMVLPVVIEV